MLMCVEIGRFVTGDLDGMLALQDANHVDRLAPGARRRGFLSARFSRERFEALAADLAVVVAREGGCVVGFMCASRRDFQSGSPIVAGLLAALDGLAFDGRGLPGERLCIYGPVCIAAEQRGRGLLRRLFATLKAELAGSFEIGVAFIARENPHSFQAHVHGLGMLPIGSFSRDERRFDIVAFAL
jgi:hypothetical protein